jgi:fimbrial chaperone protein
MRSSFRVIAFVCAGALPARANSLRVAPTLLDVMAPGSTTTLTLRNDGDQQLHIQLRVFHWTGTQGEPILEPTSDVVVSPPAATLTSGTEYVVRIVRVAKQPVADEESYRILVDEVPDAVRDHNSSIQFAMRYSIPVFFASAAASSAKIAWSFAAKGNALILTVLNSGARRLRIANLKLSDASGALLLQRPGLVGYALGKSSTSWTLPAGAKTIRHESLRVVADSETGAINAVAVMQPPR